MTLDDITAEFKAIRRMPIVEAGTAYTEASTALTKAANDLVTHATKLAQAWGGEAADKHLAQFQKLHTTATELADASFKAGRAHTWLGSKDMLGWYQDTGGSLKAGFFHTDGDDADAREFRDRFLNRLTEAIHGGPDVVKQDLPDAGKEVTGYGPTGSGTPQAGGGGPGAGNPGGGGMPKMPTDHAGGLPNGGAPTDQSGGLPNGGLPGGDPSGNLPGGGSGGLPGGDPSGNLPGGGLPGDGSSLQNFPGDGAGGLGGGGLGGGGLGSGGLGGGAGGLPGGGLGGGAGGLPGGGLSGGAGGLPGSGLSGAGAANEALAAERAALSGAGGANGMGMGMPMGAGGGGGGDQSEETERSTWLTEDEDIWGGNGNTTSAVIG
jgi:uncharacterized protein YukE